MDFNHNSIYFHKPLQVTNSASKVRFFFIFECSKKKEEFYKLNFRPNSLNETFHHSFFLRFIVVLRQGSEMCSVKSFRVLPPGGSVINKGRVPTGH